MNPYDSYSSFTNTTAIYPQHVAAEYLALGLASEAAECVEAVVLKFRVEALGDELSDVQWYAARLANHYGFTLSDLVAEAKREYHPNFDEAERLFALITVEAGLIAGKVKKQLRDGDTWTGEQREDARRYIRDRLIRIIMFSMQASDWFYQRGYPQYGSYGAILDANRAKLEARKQRGTLRGDGNR